MSQMIDPNVGFIDNATGAAVALGTAYFGIPFEDPETDPKAPYSDRALTTAVSATQALTSAGKPAQRLYLSGAYSLTVKDSAGVVVFSYDYVTGIEGGGTSDGFASMEALRLSATSSDYIETTSFYAGGTTGGAKLYRDGTGTPTGSGAAVIAAALAAGTFCNAAGNCYKLSADQMVNMYQFGAKLNGSDDDRLFVIAAWEGAVAIGANELWFPPGTALVSAQIAPTVGNLIIRGFGKFLSIFKIGGTYANQTQLFDCTSISNVEIYNCGFDGNLANQGVTTTADNKQIAIALRGTSSDWTIKGCHFKNWGKDGVYIGTVNNKRIDIDSDFENIRRIGVTIVAGDTIKVRGKHYLGKDQTNAVSNNAVHWEPNGVSDSVANLDISVQCVDMQGGVVLYNSPSATQQNINVHDCEFYTITERSAIVVYACGSVPVTIANNKGYACGNTAASGVQTDGGGITHENSVIVATGNTWNTCGGYLGTVAADGSSGRGSIYNDNIHINDVRRGVYWGYVFGAGTTGSLRSIQGNTMLAGGSGTANTYPAIEIKNTSSHNGSGDVIKHNQIQTSTTSGYSAGVVIDYDDTTSIVSDNPIVGNGVKYTFTNGTIARAGNKTSGTVTLSAAATTTVNNAQVLSNSQIVLMPTNAAAATLMSGSKALYVSARTAATSFVLSTADGTNAAGTETFAWFLN